MSEMSQKEFEEAGCAGCLLIIVGLLSPVLFLGVILSEVIHWLEGRGFYPWVP